MTKVRCLLLAALVAGCGNANGDVIVPRNHEVEGIDGGGGDRSRVEMDGGTDRGGGPQECTMSNERCAQHCSTSSDCNSDKQRFCDTATQACVECRRNADCTEGENPTCIAGQCLH